MREERRGKMAVLEDDTAGFLFRKRCNSLHFK
jgi:hypothetical protein